MELSFFFTNNIGAPHGITLGRINPPAQKLLELLL